MSQHAICPKPKRHPDDGGRINYMTRSGGYVMCRRPGLMPFTMTEKDWRKLELWERDKQ